MAKRIVAIGKLIAGVTAVTLFAAIPAKSQSLPPSAAQFKIPMPEPVQALPEPDAIDLKTGGVPGMEPEVWEKFLGQVMVRDVSRATLTPVLPPKAKATGAAVIVMPGGGFNGLAIVSEGASVAKWLADRGIAAFVLKYRLNPTPGDAAAYKAFLEKKLNAAGQGAADAPKPTGGRGDLSTPPQSFEDGMAALRLVRSRAAEWGVSPDRVGVVGFSAGAILGLSLARSGAADGPNFACLLYPSMEAVDVPPNAPPLFIAMAADDPLFGRKGYGLAESWTKAGRLAELHVYQKGGHGFGLGAPDTTTTDWAPSFVHWLQMNAILGAAP